MKNPYYNIWKKLPPGRFATWRLRRTLTKKFAWAIPDQTAIELCCKYSPIIEIGAGTGYWASLISAQGGKITCFDKYVDHNDYGHTKQYIEVAQGDHTILERFPHIKTLFLCWPPYDTAMAYNCIKAFKGKYLIDIGEGPHGCTGNDAFHNELEVNWDLVENYCIPQWDGMHDELNIYKRK